MTCPACHAPVVEGARFCPACGHALGPPDSSAVTGSAGPTRRADEAPTVAATPSDSGWLTSSGSIDHGQFTPGAVLDGRYRVVGLLGRGGMGEVYRADDLRLGQSVALKFLPPSLGRDAQRLAQFHNEVRTARQVSHANVCRVYDIGETHHQLYLSMEYVDGEDLGSLLRRIGRLPEDKAVEIARQICAGLAAAHERGVVHRDLKPANIMLDGSGRARIMDFSLAAVGTVTDVASGTPAYMAPEQLAGRDVTARSDLYSLGLVLYELFTGRRAFDAKTLADLVSLRESGSLTSPTTLVKTLDPAIERAILRCLETDPNRRPPTALSVAAALPGGDPMAAALAAGETPSPDMVAAVGGDASVLSAARGLTWVAVTVAGLALCGLVSDRVSILAKVPLAKPPAVLIDRAQQIRAALGYTTPPSDQTSGLAYATSYLTWADTHGAEATDWAELRSARPAPVRLWYRTSAGPIVPLTPQAQISPADPPPTNSGMTEVDVDTLGRLVGFSAAPPEVEATGPVDPAAVDWAALFQAADLDLKTFTDATPARTPPTFADTRRAWRGPLPGRDTIVQIEAAGYRGRPVYFEIVGPWTAAARDGHAVANSQGETTFSAIFVLILLVVAAWRARVNLRSGRADRRGATRVAIFFVIVLVGAWVGADHVRSVTAERDRLFSNTALALFVGAAMFLVYLALEPEVRRNWPTMLVGWSRVLSGRLRDTLVGRDLLIGAAAGALFAAVSLGVPTLLTLRQHLAPMPMLPAVQLLLGPGPYLRAISSALNGGVQNGLLSILLVVLFRELARQVASRLGRRGPTVDRVATGFAVVALVSINAISGGPWTDVVYQAMTSAIELIVLLRIGLLAACVMYTVRNFLDAVPLTVDPGRIYATDAWVAMALVLGVAAIGFWCARGDEPLLGQADAA